MSYCPDPSRGARGSIRMLDQIVSHMSSIRAILGITVCQKKKKKKKKKTTTRNRLQEKNRDLLLPPADLPLSRGAVGCEEAQLGRNVDCSVKVMEVSNRK